MMAFLLVTRIIQCQHMRMPLHVLSTRAVICATSLCKFSCPLKRLLQLPPTPVETLHFHPDKHHYIDLTILILRIFTQAFALVPRNDPRLASPLSYGYIL